MNTLFIAIPLSKVIKSQLARLCYGLPNVHWVEPHDFYITVVQLGPIDGTLQLDIQDVLAKLRIPPFDLHLDGVGIFPQKKAKSVIWAGVSHAEQLSLFVKTIVSGLIEIVPKIEQRKIAPHVVLGDYDTVDKKRLADYLDSGAAFITNPFTNDYFVLLRSQKTASETIIYQELAKYKMLPPVDKLKIIN